VTDETRMESLWVWVADNGTDGIGAVAANLPGFGWTVLQNRKREVAEKMQPTAQSLARFTGRKIWLREFRMVADHHKEG
jgi:peptide subunit release factor 1 (eRF1)